jgi:hypothetical protein
MAAKAKNTSYKALISKTESEVAVEQLDLRVEQAELNFQQGLLSMKGKMISAEGEVKKQEANVKSAIKSLENAKSSSPERIVQAVVDAKTAVKQAEVNLISAQEAYNELKEMYEFLETTKSELFS